MTDSAIKKNTKKTPNQIDKLFELVIKGPKDDLISNIRKPDGKFHQVKILKKDKSNKLLNDDDIDININNINKEKPKPKVNVIIINNKKVCLIKKRKKTKN